MNKEETLNVFSIRIAESIGLAYWTDTFPYPLKGSTHNIILLFVRIQWGKLTATI